MENQGGNAGNRVGNAGNQGGNLLIGVEMMNKKCRERYLFIITLFNVGVQT